MIYFSQWVIRTSVEPFSLSKQIQKSCGPRAALAGGSHSIDGTNPRESTAGPTST
jgi:hypothetical protein